MFHLSFKIQFSSQHNGTVCKDKTQETAVIGAQIQTVHHSAHSSYLLSNQDKIMMHKMMAGLLSYICLLITAKVMGCWRCFTLITKHEALKVSQEERAPSSKPAGTLESHQTPTGCRATNMALASSRRFTKKYYKHAIWACLCTQINTIIWQHKTRNALR